jgi:hypothetical protein
VAGPHCTHATLRASAAAASKVQPTKPTVRTATNTQCQSAPPLSPLCQRRQLCLHIPPPPPAAAVLIGMPHAASVCNYKQHATCCTSAGTITSNPSTLSRPPHRPRCPAPPTRPWSPACPAAGPLGSCPARAGTGRSPAGGLGVWGGGRAVSDSSLLLLLLLLLCGRAMCNDGSQSVHNGSLFTVAPGSLRRAGYGQQVAMQNDCRERALTVVLHRTKCRYHLYHGKAQCTTHT